MLKREKKRENQYQPKNDTATKTMLSLTPIFSRQPLGLSLMTFFVLLFFFERDSNE